MALCLINEQCLLVFKINGVLFTKKIIISETITPINICIYMYGKGPRLPFRNVLFR